MDIFNDRRFEEHKNLYKDITIPETIDQFIRTGVVKAKVSKNRMNLRRLIRIASVAVLVIACIIVVNTPHPS